jgi:hypothetical protein
MNSRILQGLIDSEPPREEGKHRFMGGTCVDCGHPLDEICTANLNLSPTEKGFCESVLPGKKNATAFGCIRLAGHTGLHCNGRRDMWR